MVTFEQRPRSDGVNFVDAGGKSTSDRRNSLYKGGKQPKDWPGWGAEGAKVRRHCQESQRRAESRGVT